MSSCNCPNPPGGGVVCEPGQLAICRVVSDGCNGECHAPPQGLTTMQVRSWAYGVISGRPRWPYAPLTATEEAILDHGVYTDPTTGIEVRFSLP